MIPMKISACGYLLAGVHPLDLQTNIRRNP